MLSTTQIAFCVPREIRAFGGGFFSVMRKFPQIGGEIYGYGIEGMNRRKGDWGFALNHPFPGSPLLIRQSCAPEFSLLPTR